MSYTKTTPRYIWFPRSANFSVPPTNFGVQDISTVRSGSKGVNWRRAIRDGNQAGTNFSQDSFVVRAKQDGFAILHTTDFEYEGQSSGPNHSFEQVTGMPVVSGGYTPYSHLSTNLSEIDSASLTLLYKKIRKETSNMNGLQFFGELREAIRMIKRPATALRDGLLNYDRLLRKRKKAIDPRIPLAKKLDIWKDVVAGTWLEASFGWKPLISDSQDIAQTIAKVVSKDDVHTRVRAYVEGELGTNSFSGTNSYNNSSNIGVTTFGFEQTVGGVLYIVGMQVLPASGPFASVDRIRNLFGLTLENFVPTLYELTPWSFLLDYFTNVGDLINSAFTNTANIRWQIRTSRFQTTRTQVSQPFVTQTFNPPFLNFKDFKGRDSATQIVKSSVEREVLTHLELPNIEFRLPGSSYKWANIAALCSPLYHNRFRF